MQKAKCWFVARLKAFGVIFLTEVMHGKVAGSSLLCYAFCFKPLV
jgi:hypothetical protein